MSRPAPDRGAGSFGARGSESKAAARTGEAGFTVLESLVAFVILVGLTAAMMQLAQGSFGVSGRAAQLRDATEIAQGALARLGVDIPVEAGEVSYREGPVSVTIAMSPYEPNRPQIFVGESKAMLAEVAATHDAGGQTVRLSTIVLTKPEGF